MSSNYAMFSNVLSFSKNAPKCVPIQCLYDRAVCCAGQAAQIGFIGTVCETVPAVNTECNMCTRINFLMIFYSSCKISKPIWFAKHNFNSAGYKESHRPAEEIT